MARPNLPHPEERRQARLAVRDAAMRRLLTMRGRKMEMQRACRRCGARHRSCRSLRRPNPGETSTMDKIAPKTWMPAESQALVEAAEKRLLANSSDGIEAQLMRLVASHEGHMDDDS